MKTFNIFTLGCQMNYADANRLRAVLKSCGLKEVDENNADLMVIVACSVKQKPIQRIWGKLRNWQKQNTYPEHSRGKKVWITGCVLPSDKKKFMFEVDKIFGIDEIGKIPKWLKSCHSGISKKYPESIQIDKNLSWIPHPRKSFAQRGRQVRDDIIGENYKTKNYLEICPIDNSKIKNQKSKLLLDKNIKSSLATNCKSQTPYLLPIMTGCNNFCSYCAVPYCRGPEVSRSMKNIIDELKLAIKNGNKRILLLGQNVNLYSVIVSDGETISSDVSRRSETISNKLRDSSASPQNDKNDFIKLLQKIEKLKGDFTYNFMTSHPKDLSQNLIEFLSKSKKWERELHLPLQSGSDRILKLMNRKYTIDNYLKIIKNFKFQISNFKFSTDIIVGFPTETKKDFESTLKALKTINPKKVYVSQFSPRPGTAAAKMKDDVSSVEKKRRWKIINNIYNKSKASKS